MYSQRSIPSSSSPSAYNFIGNIGLSVFKTSDRSIDIMGQIDNMALVAGEQASLTIT